MHTVYSVACNTLHTGTYVHCIHSHSPSCRETIPAVVLLTRLTPPPLEVAHQFLPRLATFCILYSLALLSIHDADFYRQDSTGLVETAMFSQACLTEMCVLLRDAAVAITLVTHQRRASAKFWGTQREEKEVSQAELSFVLQVRIYIHT